MSDYPTSAESFDYRAEAELFCAAILKSQRLPVTYKRFAHAADAIRFAIEELPPQVLIGTHLEVDEERFQGKDIRRLYESAHYPHARRQ
jgi:hypothetical protein